MVCRASDVGSGHCLNDAAWFYSSLAQVAAAVVAFLGGFLLLRLQDYERYWQDILARLKANQARWVQDQNIQSDASFSWNELVRAVEEQKQAAVPHHIFWSGGCLGLLFLIGSVAPLFALGQPSNGAKSWFLLPVATLVLAFVLIAYFRSRDKLAELKAFELWPRVEDELIEQEMQNEAWKARKEWEEEEKQRKRLAATASDEAHEAAPTDPDAGRS